MSAFLLNWLKPCKILVVGDVGLDAYVSGTVDRISPEAPVPVLRRQSEEFRLGMAANVAANVASLGSQATLCSLVGHDEAGIRFLGLANAAGVDTSMIRMGLQPTTVKTRFVAGGHQLLRVDEESTAAPSNGTRLEMRERIQVAVRQCDVVVVEDYAKGLFSAQLLKKVIAAARAAGKPVIVDPNVNTPRSNYVGCSMITPNVKETEALTGIRPDTEEKMRDAASVLQQRLRLPATAAPVVVLTLGEKGLACAYGRRWIRMPTVAKQVFDVSGAGDTVVAALAIMVANGNSIDNSLLVANLAAGIAVSKAGTSVVTREELGDAALALEWTGESAADQEADQRA